MQNAHCKIFISFIPIQMFYDLWIGQYPGLILAVVETKPSNLTKTLWFCHLSKLSNQNNHILSVNFKLKNKLTLFSYIVWSVWLFWFDSFDRWQNHNIFFKFEGFVSTTAKISPRYCQINCFVFQSQFGTNYQNKKRKVVQNLKS